MLEIERHKSEPTVSRRLATTDDLPRIAKIHKAAYSRNHFTALLPEDVLVRYYGGFLSGGTEICLALDVSVEKDEIVQGFSVYGVGIPEKIAAFKKACAKDILVTSLRHPWTSARKAIRAMLAKLGRHTPYDPADFLVLSIAVVCPMRGVGKTLLSGVTAVAKQRRYKTVGLYVNEDNIRAINAYFLSGFRIKKFHDGQYYMEIEL
jgi:ribosomal protein S18 acetylase RimI-like enzyme